MEIQYRTDGISTQNPHTNDFLESVFFHGNGYIGARGFPCEDQSQRPHQKGLYMAGVFDELKPGITDIVNTPNFLGLTVKVEDQDLHNASKSAFCQQLSFRDGVLAREYVASFGQKHIKIRLSRFFSLADVHTTVIRLEVTPLDFEGELTVLAALDATSCNLPIQDDQVKKNTETVRYVETVDSSLLEDGGLLVYKTRVTRITIAQAFCLKLSDNVQVLSRQNQVSEQGLDYMLTFRGRAQETYVIDKIITVYTSRDIHTHQIKDMVLNHLSLNGDKGYDRLLKENEAAWARRWETSDVVISGDERAQCAIRYTIFQLIANNASQDSAVSIGARGLTHARYKGCYFWDTEIFMLPFYIYTNPEAAKNLLLYRYHTLDAAREHAKRMTAAGARYPWMTSYDGSEQCESWDIGACEVHITADVVYGMDHYIRATGDTQFLLDQAAEVYLETARFWESRFTYDQRSDHYNMLFVKGPDEYCGATQNNTYTNMLAVYNLTLALETLKFLEAQHKEVHERLISKLGLKTDELLRWEDIIQKAVIPYDKEKDLYLQDETFMLLEPLDVARIKSDNIPLYHRICFDRLQRYRVIKQADLVLLVALFPHKFTQAQKKAIWDFYEPITLHDSTLSYGIHALIAAQLGLKEKAWNYFCKSLYLDLDNIMENTGSEGLHLAALGASWQALFFGFAGLSLEDGMPKAAPNLPDNWSELRFTFLFQGKQWRFEAKRDENGSMTAGTVFVDQ